MTYWTLVCFSHSSQNRIYHNFANHILCSRLGWVIDSHTLRVLCLKHISSYLNWKRFVCYGCDVKFQFFALVVSLTKFLRLQSALMVLPVHPVLPKCCFDRWAVLFSCFNAISSDLCCFLYYEVGSLTFHYLLLCCRKHSRNQCQLVHFSARKTFELSVFGGTNLKISSRLRATSFKCIGLGALVDLDGAAASGLVPVIDQVLLMASIFLTYMAGVVPLEKSYTSYQKTNSDIKVFSKSLDDSGR